EYPRIRKQGPHLLFDAFGADAEALDVAAAAGRASARKRLGAAAVVALQAAQGRVVDEGDAAVRTFARLAAVAAEDEGRQPAPIQEQDRLLAALQRSTDCRVQLAAQGAEVLRRNFGTHIDDGDRWQRPAQGAVRE